MFGEFRFFLQRILHWTNRTKELRYSALRCFNAPGCTKTLGEKHDPEIQRVPAETTPRRQGDPAMWIAESRNVRSEFGWGPQYPELKSIVQLAWDWHQFQPKGY